MHAALQMYSFLTGLFVQALPLSAEDYEALLFVFMHVKSKDLIISLFPDAALKGFFFFPHMTCLFKAVESAGTCKMQLNLLFGF